MRPVFILSNKYFFQTNYSTETNYSSQYKYGYCNPALKQLHPEHSRPAWFGFVQVHFISFRRYDGAGGMLVIIGINCPSEFLRNPCSSSFNRFSKFLQVFVSRCARNM